MPTITYIEFGGAEHVMDVAEGWSVMEGAVQNGVPGIDAECGGACACATCMVFVDEAWMPRVGEAEDMERDMLDCTDRATANARLSCQIKVCGDLDGLIVRLPESQH